jgi:hypothetical protein
MDELAAGPRDRPKVERLETCELVGVSGVHVFPVDMGGPVVFVRNDRELDMPDYLSIRRRDAVEMTYRQLPGKVVQGASQVVQRIPNDQAPVVADLYEAVNPVDHGPLVWLILSPQRDTFRVAFASFSYFGSKLIEVPFRPFELCPAPREIERVRHA